MSLQSFFASKSICFLVGGLVILTGFAYLIQTNGSATKGYQMRDLEKKIAALQADNSKMSLESVRLESISNVLASAKGLDLVPTDNLEIVNSISPVMAYQR